MANFFSDNDDLRFYFERGIDWGPLIELTEFGYKSPDGCANAAEAQELYADIMSLVGEFVAERIDPIVAEVDRAPLTLKDGEVVEPPAITSLFEELKALELHGMTLPRELGGQNCPMLLFSMTGELFARADVSIMAHHGFHGGIAMAMLVYSMQEGSTRYDRETGKILETRWGREIEEIRTGEAWGCMDITEPNAGSDMAALSTVGEQDDDGQWYVTGQKIFITSGHGKYHFVIARTEPAAGADSPFGGLEGLSMFMVPAYEDTDEGRKRLVKIDRLEEKLGHHSSVTAALTFERSPAQLIGKRGEGFKYMLMLMNGARVGVGFECIGLCESALRMARAYASDRRSMGKTIDQHEIIADYLDEMDVDILGLRALAMYAGYHDEMAKKHKIMLDAGVEFGDLSAEDRAKLERRHRRRARRATPLLKYLGAEKAVEIARRCLQIHGGSGYTTEYGAEKLLRDALVMPIYEGTSQIQALMAMKDVLSGAMKDPRRFAARTADARWRSVSADDALAKRVARIQSLSLSAQRHLLTKTAADKARSLEGLPFGDWPRQFFKNWDPKRDFAYAMLHAERLIKILCDELIVEILLEQTAEHPERGEILERYLERAELRVRHNHAIIVETGERIINRLRDAERAAEAESA